MSHRLIVLERTLRRAMEAMADLELESRGGGGGALSEDSVAVRAVLSAAR